MTTVEGLTERAVLALNEVLTSAQAHSVWITRRPRSRYSVRFEAMTASEAYAMVDTAMRRFAAEHGTLRGFPHETLLRVRVKLWELRRQERLRA